MTRRGWYREHYRHALAAKGISTRKIRKYDVAIARNLSEDPSDPDIIYTTENLGEEKPKKSVEEEVAEKKQDNDEELIRLEKKKLELELERARIEIEKYKAERNKWDMDIEKLTRDLINLFGITEDQASVMARDMMRDRMWQRRYVEPKEDDDWWKDLK